MTGIFLKYQVTHNSVMKEFIPRNLRTVHIQIVSTRLPLSLPTQEPAYGTVTKTSLSYDLHYSAYVGTSYDLHYSQYVDTSYDLHYSA